MSSGKVNCTCGWSWNKSDSSKKDMYICHECGRDNSNNMKNGGWLDSYADGGTMQEHQENYNDYKVSAPEGMVGDGFSNVGRNYSPAWGGQFEDGGEIPNAQNGKATRADSLAVYNNTRAIDDYFKKQGYTKQKVTDTKRHKESEKFAKSWVGEAQKNLNAVKKQTLISGLVTQASKNEAIKSAKSNLKEAQKALSETKDKVNPKKYLKNLEEAREKFEERKKDTGKHVDEQGIYVNEKPDIEKYYLPIDENTFNQREQAQGFLDLRSPMPLYDKRITPQYLSVYKSPEAIESEELREKLRNAKTAKERAEIEKQFNNLKYTDNVEMYDYDQLAVMPFDMVPPELQEERIRKYGTEGVPASFIEQHPDWVTKPITDSGQRQPVQSIQNNLKPKGLIQSNADVSGLKPQVRQPKYYDIQENINQPFGGSQTNYRTSDLNSITSPDDLGPGNTRKIVPHYQKGGKLKFLQPTSDKLPEGYRIPYDTPSTERASSIGGTDGEPAYLVPEFKYGQPIYDSIEEFKRTGEHLGGPFKTWQEAEEWENTVRHPAVENRETIMFPQEKFQTGGSIPGSVGFTYARTKGIPSNGPYAKKTLASAQNGVDMYGNPIIAKENYIKGAGRSNYSPRTNISNLYDLDPRYNHTRAHENYHARQFAEGRSNFDIGHNTENALWAAMQKRPEITSTEEVFDSFHNRKQKEMEMDRPDMVNIVPETRFMPSRLIDKYIDRNGLQYRNPNSMEGEAEYYGDLGEEYYKIPKGQNGMEMKYYQNGLDFKPKSISRNGAWLNKYDVAQNGKKKFKLKDERLQAIRPSESTFVKKPNFEAEQAKVQRTYVDQVGKQMAEEKRRKKLTKDQREREDYNARNEQTGSIQTPVEESTWDRTKAIVSNPLTAFGYAARNESLPTRFQHGDRNTLDYAVDWVNPLQGAAALSEIPGELGRGEFLNAGLSALDAADLGVYAKGAIKASKPLLQKAGQQLGNVRTSISPELRQGLRTAGPSFGSDAGSKINWGEEYFKKIQNKEKELQDLYISKKITDKEYLAGVPLYEKELAKELGLENKLGSGNYGKVFELPNDPTKVIKLGNPMSAGGTGATNWTPELIEKLKSIKQNANIAIPEQVEYFEIPSLYQGYGPKIKEVMTMPNLNQVAAENLNLNKRDRYALFLKQARQLRDQGIALDVKNIENFKFNKNKGVFDIYDVNPGYISNPGYYMQDVVNKTKGPLFEHMQFKQGGIIKDDMGQWKYPGQITEIDSNQITMQGVPYDVLGISDTGDTKLMKPGKDYKFKGKKVTEFPMAKNGRRQEQKGLVNLDDLLNFTNYNKQQPAGWLSKYN